VVRIDQRLEIDADAWRVKRDAGAVGDRRRLVIWRSVDDRRSAVIATAAVPISVHVAPDDAVHVTMTATPAIVVWIVPGVCRH
jgi:hypothetical protein